MNTEGHVERTASRGRGAPSDPLVRLSVNLSTEVADELKEYATRKGVSITEAVRRAITVLRFVDNAQNRGATVHLEEGGSLKEVLFLG